MKFLCFVAKVDTFKNKQTNKKRYRQVHCEDLAKWIDSIVRFDSWQLGWDILCAELLSIFLGRDQIV